MQATFLENTSPPALNFDHTTQIVVFIATRTAHESVAPDSLHGNDSPEK